MEQLVFIGGMARSGINLLRTMLDCHPQIAAGPALNNMESISNLFIEMSESHRSGQLGSYLSEDALTGLLQGFVEGMLLPYARSKGKAIAVESSANTIWAFPVLAQLFPQAKFINVIRDGRDVVASHRNVAQRLFERGLPDTSNAGSALQTGAMWREVVNVGNSLCGPQADLAREGRAITVRYEDLVFAPVQELQRICRLLDVQFDQEMLHPEARSHDGAIDDIWITSANATRTISTDSIGRWLSELPFRERMLFMAAAQDTLVAVHYEINDEWSMRNLTISQEDALLELELVQEEIALMQQPTAQQVEASHDAGMNDGALKIEKVVVDSASATGLAPTALKSDPQEPPASIAPIRR